MKLGSLFVTTLAATSIRPHFVNGACSGDDESFYFDASSTILDATLSGCYAVAPGGAEANGVRVFTLNGDEQADGDMVFFATGSVTDDDSLVWAVGVYDSEDDSHSKKCYDGNLQEVADLHPSAVTSWNCLGDTSGEYEIEVQSTCNCITPAPSVAPISPSPSPTQTSRPTPTPATPVPTEPPTVPTPSPTLIPTQAPASVSLRVPTPSPTLVPTQAPASVVVQVPTPSPTLVPIQAPASVVVQAPVEEDPRWLDAAWQIAITVIGSATVATIAAFGTYVWRRSFRRS